MRSLLTGFVFAFASAAAQAAVIATPVEYSLGDTEMSGFLVHDDATTRLRPGLVMVPNWLGVTDDAVARAKELARSDYVILVADMYGKGVRPKDPTEAMAQVRTMYANVELMRERANAAVDALRAQAGKLPVDPQRIGALGFCFGGSTVLELARSGADVLGVVSLHGGLTTSKPAVAGTLKAPILVLNGAADTAVKAEDIAGFGAEMDGAGADWQFVNFSGAVHCFAEPSAARPPNCVYNERAAKRAYRMTDAFFSEAFAKVPVRDRP